ncbi:MAG: DUF4492 domain-containing protein [Bacteroidales bacterium]|nr:DUF4492 domain-containing protein [Bacteroidales bacterium]
MGKDILGRIWRFYRDGFRNMTWGRPLWILVIAKLIILFLVLRLFFFKPALAGKSEAEKIEIVGNRFTATDSTDTNHKHQ